MNVQSTVKITGDRTGGYILTVQDSMGFKGDIALNLGELDKIYQILLKFHFEKVISKKRNESIEKKLLQEKRKGLFSAIKSHKKEESSKKKVKKA